MSLSRSEFQIRKRLKRRSTILLFDAACLSGWSTTAAIAELAGVSRRRAELELAELVRDGWLFRAERGPRNQQREVRFQARVAAIAGDRTGAIVEDRTGAIVHDRSERGGGAIVHDRSTHYPTRARDGLSGSMDLNRPSVLGGAGGNGTDGRRSTSAETAEGKFAEPAAELVGSIADDWDLDRAVVRACLGRFLADVGLLPERQLRRYLRAAWLHREQRRSHEAFRGIGGVETFFGRVCTRLRYERWLELERTAAAQRENERRELEHERELEREEVQTVSTAELERDVGEVMRGLRR